MLLYLYFALEQIEISWTNVKNALKEIWIIELVLGSYCLWNLLMIVVGVGTNAPDYVKIDSRLSLWQYFKVFLNNFRLHLRIGQYGVFVVGLLLLCRKEFFKIICLLKWEILLALSIMLPQMAVYSKTGLEERYVMPWIYGFAYLFVVAFSKEKVLFPEKRRIYDYLLWALTITNLILVCYEATYFTYRGRGIEQMFNRVMEEVKENEDVKILSAFAPYNESDQTTSYWFHKNGIYEIYVYREGICKDWYRLGEGNTIALEDIDIIMTYNFNDRHFFKEPEIDWENYEIEEYNTMRVAVRKE